MSANTNLTCCLDLWSSGRQVEAETTEEAEMQSLLVNNVTNETRNLNVESTLPSEQSDAGMDHRCETIREMLPVSQLEWTALHIASARAQQHSVQSLLEQGTDVNAKDLFCRTPLDVAGSAHYEGYTIDENNFMETVDLLVKAGGKFLKCRGQCCLNTPLHTAVELGSEAAVRQILEGGASVTAWKSIGYTAMHMCVEKRNEILLELLASHESRNEGSNLASINVADQKGRTVLCAAVEAKWLQGVRIALSAGVTNIQATRIHGYFENERTTVFHLAAEQGSTDVLKHLLDYYPNQDEIKNIVNMFDALGPPIYYAVCNNHADCVSLLILKGAKVNILIDGEVVRESVTLLALAVCNRNTKIAEMIMRSDKETVNAFESSVRSPLYIACGLRDKKMITLLLQYDADLTGGENEEKFVPLKIFMKTLSKPTEFMQKIFDSNIVTLGWQNEDEAMIDFKIIMPRCGKKKIQIIQALLDTGNTYNQQDLLLHPLVESFLYLQWISVLPYFYIILALHVFFVLSLIVFTISWFWFIDKKMEPQPDVFRACIYVIYLTNTLITLQENVVIKKITFRYLLRSEISVKWLSTILAVAFPSAVLWDFIPNPEWVRFLGSVTLLFAWVRLMYLLSRLPDRGYYVLMYGKVAIKVFKVLGSFSFLIIGFCMSFMIQFHAQPPFEDILSSLLTTMVMMSSELGYNEIINKRSLEHASASLIMIRLIFASFLIFVSIILMNLLVAVGVSDVNTLEHLHKLNRLKKQVQFIKSFEETTDYICFMKIILLPMYLYERWFLTKIPRYFIIQRYGPRKYNRGLPTRLIEAIFDNLELQKRQSDEKDMKLHKFKLDEIYEVIVKKDSGVPPHPDIPDNTMNQVLEEITKIHTGMKEITKIHTGMKEITKIHTGMKEIKNRIGKMSRCSRCRNSS